MFHETLSVLLSISAAYLAYSLSQAIYNVTLHPLAKFPGPRWRGAFYFPFFYEIWTGDVVSNWHKLHEVYGNIVRISPTCVSFIGADAWKDIYGQNSKKKAFVKDPDVYAPPADGVADIGSANEKDHSRIRRQFAYGLSPQALQRQESLVQVHLNLFIQKLHEKAATDRTIPIDLVRWFNFTTFDIIGDLCFGESFGALQNEEYNFWIANIFKGLKFVRMFRVLRAYPIVGWPLLKILTLFPALQKARQKHMQYTAERTTRRLDDAESTREDIMSHVLRQNGERGMSREEIIKSAGTIIMAGSETSATLLSGAMFHLLTNPRWLTALQDEIRQLDEQDLSFVSLAKMKVLNAVIQETSRLYPPLPSIMPRVTPSEGALVDGVWVPGGIGVGIAQYPANRSSRNFTDPDAFEPGRWLGHERYRDDALGAVQPFSMGPRNCLGQPLALAEIRAILAMLLWHFDLELDDSCKAWDQQKVFILWEKRPLLVRLSPKL